MIYIATILLIAIILFTIPFVFLCIQSIYINLRTKVPWAKTPEKNLKIILKEIAKLKIPKNSLIYDLGCGDGRLLFLAEKYGYRAIGFELSLYPYLKCIIKKYFSKSKIKIQRKNFYNINLCKADVIFVFLVGPVMKKVEKKLKNELKQNTLVISYGFQFSGPKETKIINTKPSKTYIYYFK